MLRKMTVIDESNESLNSQNFQQSSFCIRLLNEKQKQKSVGIQNLSLEIHTKTSSLMLRRGSLCFLSETSSPSLPLYTPSFSLFSQLFHSNHIETRSQLLLPHTQFIHFINNQFPLFTRIFADESKSNLEVNGTFWIPSITLSPFSSSLSPSVPSFLHAEQVGILGHVLFLFFVFSDNFL